MIFHIAICSPDGALRSRLEHQCMEFFARREDACIVEQLQGPDALLQQDAAGLRYELYLIELAAVARPEGLAAAAELTTGEDVASLSLRVPFSAVAQPLLADGRFVQPHRSYVVNLEAVQLLSPGEVRMRSGARIPIPRGRETAVREAFCARVG